MGHQCSRHWCSIVVSISLIYKPEHGIHSPNRHLERTMSDALEEHEGKVSIGGKNITNERDIDVPAEEEQEL